MALWRAVCRSMPCNSKGSVTFSTTSSGDSRLGAWNTIAIGPGRRWSNPPIAGSTRQGHGHRRRAFPQPYLVEQRADALVIDGADEPLRELQVLFDAEMIDEVANKLYIQWGVGKKTTNEGALFLFAIRDRKSRLEVGYGLEPYVPDGSAGDVLRAMRPALRAGGRKCCPAKREPVFETV